MQLNLNLSLTKPWLAEQRNQIWQSVLRKAIRKIIPSDEVNYGSIGNLVRSLRLNVALVLSAPGSLMASHQTAVIHSTSVKRSFLNYTFRQMENVEECGRDLLGCAGS